MDEGFDLGRLLQAVAVFVFFVLPVLKNIAASKKAESKLPGGQDPAKRPGRKGSAPPPEGEGQRQGLEQWERLLRGELPPERPPAAPPAPPVVAPVSQRDTRPMPEAGVAPTRPLPIPLDAAPGGSSASRILERGMEGVSGGLGSDQSFAERTLELPAAMNAEPGAGLVEGTGSLPVAPELGGLRSSRRRSGARASLEVLDTRAWQRALITAELLAPPLALRDRPAWPGGPAMS